MYNKDKHKKIEDLGNKIIITNHKIKKLNNLLNEDNEINKRYYLGNYKISVVISKETFLIAYKNEIKELETELKKLKNDYEKALKDALDYKELVCGVDYPAS